LSRLPQNIPPLKNIAPETYQKYEDSNGSKEKYKEFLENTFSFWQGKSP
jgi:hypothetical protein